MSVVNLTEWLLAARTPSIRYLTLRHLLGHGEDDVELRAAQRDLMSSGSVPAILAGQTSAGNWAGEHSYYTPKFVSSHWSLMLLTELAVDGSDPRFQRGIDYMLTATAADLEHRLNAGKHGWLCFWGNLVRYAAHGGQACDPRVERIVHYLVHDAGDGWRCDINDELPCAWGVARALWGLAALPERSPEVQQTIVSGIELLLADNLLVTGSYPTPGKVHSMWSRLNFPLFYAADILFVLRVLGELDALGRADAQPALAWLGARRRPNGRWRGSSPFRQRTWPLSDAEETDRWVSLYAAMVLE